MIRTHPGSRNTWLAKIDQEAQAGHFLEASQVAGRAVEALGEEPELLMLQQVMSRMAEK